MIPALSLREYSQRFCTDRGNRMAYAPLNPALDKVSHMQHGCYKCKKIKIRICIVSQIPLNKEQLKYLHWAQQKIPMIQPTIPLQCQSLRWSLRKKDTVYLKPVNSFSAEGFPFTVGFLWGMRVKTKWKRKLHVLGKISFGVDKQ